MRRSAPTVSDCRFCFDGPHEKGLAAGTFLFPTTASYMGLHAADSLEDDRAGGRNRGILENFATVEGGQTEHREHLVAPVVFQELGLLCRRRNYVVHDASGKHRDQSSKENFPCL